jgi:glutamine synthetase
VLLAAGLRGIEDNLLLPDEATEDVEAMTDAERAARGIVALPGDLAEAIAEMERSELVAETLGEHVFDEFLRNKRLEWEEFRTYVSPYEVQRYLPQL